MNEEFYRGSCKTYLTPIQTNDLNCGWKKKKKECQFNWGTNFHYFKRSSVNLYRYQKATLSGLES